jgi:hypothetical protein
VIIGISLFLAYCGPVRATPVLILIKPCPSPATQGILALCSTSPGAAHAQKFD